MITSKTTESFPLYEFNCVKDIHRLMSDFKKFEEKRVPGSLKRAVSAGAGLLLAAGLFIGLMMGVGLLGGLLFALGAILFAVRGYFATGDRAVTGALIFVALVAAGIELIVHLLAS